MFGLGSAYLEKEKQRISTLEKWEYIMELYVNEIIYKKQPLALASMEIGRKVKGREGEVLHNIGEKLQNGQEDFFAEQWKKEWLKSLEAIVLAKEEKELIMQFQIFTGFENEETQKKMIILQQEKWKKIREKVQKEYQEKKKMVLLFSFSAGALIILFLI